MKLKNEMLLVALSCVKTTSKYTLNYNLNEPTLPLNNVDYIHEGADFFSIFAFSLRLQYCGILNLLLLNKEEVDAQDFFKC